MNNGCCDTLDGVSREGQDIKNEVHDAASNKPNRPKRLIVAGILIIEVNAFSFRFIRRFGVMVSSKPIPCAMIRGTDHAKTINRRIR